MNYDPEAAERVRQLLSNRDGVVEKRMVGGLSFLVSGNMCCGVTDRALMVRVGAKGRQQALREPYVRPMQLGGRTLSGFVCVDPAGFAVAARVYGRSMAGSSGVSHRSIAVMNLTGWQIASRMARHFGGLWPGRSGRRAAGTA